MAQLYKITLYVCDLEDNLSLDEIKTLIKQDALDGVAVNCVWCVGWDNLAVWAKDTIERTIKKLGKTKEDVLADVEATEKRFNDDMRKMEENRL